MSTKTQQMRNLGSPTTVADSETI